MAVGDGRRRTDRRGAGSGRPPSSAVPGRRQITLPPGRASGPPHQRQELVFAGLAGAERALPKVRHQASRCGSGQQRDWAGGLPDQRTGTSRDNFCSGCARRSWLDSRPEADARAGRGTAVNRTACGCRSGGSSSNRIGNFLAGGRGGGHRGRRRAGAAMRTGGTGRTDGSRRPVYREDAALVHAPLARKDDPVDVRLGQPSLAQGREVVQAGAPRNFRIGTATGAERGPATGSHRGCRRAGKRPGGGPSRRGAERGPFTGPGAGAGAVLWLAVPSLYWTLGPGLGRACVFGPL